MATPKSNIVRLRLTDLEKADWQRAAGSARGLSDWIRRVCNAEADATREPVPNAKPLIVAEAVEQSVQGYPARKPEPSEPDRCPRWMHHRPGVYCGSCKKVIAK